MPEDLPLPVDFGKMCRSYEMIKRLNSALLIHRIHENILVDQNTASIRARTCSQCHNNVSSSVARSGCFVSEDLIFEKVSKQIVKGRTTDNDSQVKSCSIDGGDNNPSLWLFPEYLVNKKDVNAYPSFCWKKNL